MWNVTQKQKKGKEDQEAGFPNSRSHNIKDEIWRIFTNIPTYSDGKINTALGDKVYTNIKDSIDNTTFNNPLLSRCHKIDTLHEKSHPRVDCDDLKKATKKAPSR